MGIVGNLLSPEKLWLQRIAITARLHCSIFPAVYIPYANTRTRLTCDPRAGAGRRTGTE
jgi:hypothetical protein